MVHKKANKLNQFLQSPKIFFWNVYVHIMFGHWLLFSKFSGSHGSPTLYDDLVQLFWSTMVYSLTPVVVSSTPMVQNHAKTTRWRTNGTTGQKIDPQCFPTTIAPIKQIIYILHSLINSRLKIILKN